MPLVTHGLMSGPLVTRGLLPSGVVLAASLLEALVTYLKATAPVTSLLASAGSVYTSLSSWGQEIPFLLVEDYTEDLPGVTAEDQPVEFNVCLYAGDLDSLRVLVDAVKDSLDTPNLNPNSTRTAQLTWTRGSTTGVMRNRTRIDRVPSLIRGGRLCYDARIEYVFYVTPDQ